MYLPSVNSGKAFTLLEMMTVIVLLGVLTSMVAVRMDFFGQDARQELDEFQGFLKAEHSAVLRLGESSTVRFIPRKNIIIVSRDNGEDSRRFPLNHWSIDHENPKSFRITPVGMFGPDKITLANAGQTHVLKRDRLLGLESNSTPDE